MSPDIGDLLKKALALPPEARAALATSLLDSLDQATDESAEDAWAEEIVHRIKDLESGNVRPVPWSELRRRLSQSTNAR